MLMCRRGRLRELKGGRGGKGEWREFRKEGGRERGGTERGWVEFIVKDLYMGV